MMTDHRLASFGINTFDPGGGRPTRARRAGAPSKATRAAAPVKPAATGTRSADPVTILTGAAEAETALLRTEVAALREVAAAALAEAASARAVAEAMERSAAEAQRLEALRTAPRITLL